jgi:hypothetical protein
MHGVERDANGRKAVRWPSGTGVPGGRESSGRTSIPPHVALRDACHGRTVPRRRALRSTDHRIPRVHEGSRGSVARARRGISREHERLGLARTRRVLLGVRPSACPRLGDTMAETARQALRGRRRDHSTRMVPGSTRHRAHASPRRVCDRVRTGMGRAPAERRCTATRRLPPHQCVLRERCRTTSPLRHSAWAVPRRRTDRCRHHDPRAESHPSRGAEPGGDHRRLPPSWVLDMERRLTCERRRSEP